MDMPHASHPQIQAGNIMKPTLTISVSQTNGRINRQQVKDLSHRIADIAIPPAVVVDLQGINFLGSAELSEFVELHKNVQKHGSKLVLANVTPLVYEVFHITRLTKLFDVHTEASSV